MYKVTNWYTAVQILLIFVIVVLLNDFKKMGTTLI